MPASIAAPSTSITAPQASRGLRIALWVAQALLAVAFIGAGLMKSTVPIEELAKNMSWVPRYSLSSGPTHPEKTQNTARTEKSDADRIFAR